MPPTKRTQLQPLTVPFQAHCHVARFPPTIGQLTHQGAYLGGSPQTFPLCSGPPQCPSPPTSVSSCQTPGDAGVSVHQTAHSRTAPGPKREALKNSPPSLKQKGASPQQHFLPGSCNVPSTRLPGADSPPRLSSSWLRSTASAQPGGDWGRTGSRCACSRPACGWCTPRGWSAGRQAVPRTRSAGA